MRQSALARVWVGARVHPGMFEALAVSRGASVHAYSTPRMTTQPYKGFREVARVPGLGGFGSRSSIIVFAPILAYWDGSYAS